LVYFAKHGFDHVLFEDGLMAHGAPERFRAGNKAFSPLLPAQAIS
jgi:hypothetical protein